MCQNKVDVDVSKEKISETKIEELVKRVFIETELCSIPVKIMPIVKYYGFSVFRANMPDNESGYIIVSDKVVEPFNTNKVIVYNANHSNRRNRFTVAHELAHYIFHTSEEIYAHRDSGNLGIEEINANSFVFALLMPKKEIIAFVKEAKNDFWGFAPNEYIISRVADKFNVSEQAAETRLRKLGQI